jgi:hypothetical protein
MTASHQESRKLLRQVGGRKVIVLPGQCERQITSDRFVCNSIHAREHLRSGQGWVKEITERLGRVPRGGAEAFDQDYSVKKHCSRIVQSFDIRFSAREFRDQSSLLFRGSLQSHPAPEHRVQFHIALQRVHVVLSNQRRRMMREKAKFLVIPLGNTRADGYSMDGNVEPSISEQSQYGFIILKG